MSINPINPLLSSRANILPQKADLAPQTSLSSFAKAIEEAKSRRQADGRHDSVADASATAELFSLQMMKNALSMGDDNLMSGFKTFNDPVKMIIENILTNSQNNDSYKTDQTPEVSTPPQTISTPHAGLNEIISKASQRHGIDEALIKAVVKAESNFNPNAISHAGAEGLMQLMPGTARGLGVKDSFDPEQNIMGGTRFLKDMLNRYHGNLDSALAAYNWGPGNVDRKGVSSLPQETRDYLAKVKSLYNQYTG